jgi:hypothetical protein
MRTKEPISCNAWLFNGKLCVTLSKFPEKGPAMLALRYGVIQADITFDAGGH